jgi:hypothetical protein
MATNAIALLRDLRARGVVIKASGDRLVCTPRQVLTDVDVDLLRRHKFTILAWLAFQEQNLQTVCRACGGRRFWISTMTQVICCICHPPATRELIRDEIEVEGPDAAA